MNQHNEMVADMNLDYNYCWQRQWYCYSSISNKRFAVYAIVEGCRPRCIGIDFQ